MTNYVSLNGRIDSEPKIIKQSPLLLYVKVRLANNETVNCLVARHSLDFFYRGIDGAHAALYGHYNHRKQFVITKYHIQQLSA